MYKGHRDKAKWGKFKSGRQGCVRQGSLGGMKMETTILEQQLKKKRWTFSLKEEFNCVFVECIF